MDLPSGGRAEEAPQLPLGGAAALGGLVEEGVQRALVALGADQLRDPGRAQRADEFVLQVGGTDEELPLRGAGPLQAAGVAAALPLVAQPGEAQVQSGRSEKPGEPP